MSAFYTNLAAVADRLLAKFGQDVLVSNFGLSEPDVDTGVVSQTVTTNTAKGVELDFDYRNFGDSTEAYKSVSSSDKRLLLSATNVVNPQDQLIVDGEIYKAHVIKVVKPAATRVIYDIWMQK